MQFKAEEKGLELGNTIPSKPIYVCGDANRLQQILINLVGNAIKFTDTGVVHTEVIIKEEGIQFSVSDSGVGIGQDRLKKIFESFEQAYSDTTRKFGGTGLGLSISKKLGELQGGKIWVESVKGRGSQFYFLIPYQIETEIAESNIKSPAESVKRSELSGIKILLVEDNEFNAIVAQEELENAIEEVLVETAENRAIALEKVKASTYDLILMDVQMPKMNGYEATKSIRRLQNEKASIPIIAMTANVMKEEVDMCFEAQVWMISLENPLM